MGEKEEGGGGRGRARGGREEGREGGRMKGGRMEGGREGGREGRGGKETNLGLDWGRLAELRLAYEGE